MDPDEAFLHFSPFCGGSYYATSPSECTPSHHNNYRSSPYSKSPRVGKTAKRGDISQKSFKYAIQKYNPALKTKNDKLHMSDYVKIRTSGRSMIKDRDVTRQVATRPVIRPLVKHAISYSDKPNMKHTEAPLVHVEVVTPRQAKKHVSHESRHKHPDEKSPVNTAKESDDYSGSSVPKLPRIETSQMVGAGEKKEEEKKEQSPREEKEKKETKDDQEGEQKSGGKGQYFQEELKRLRKGMEREKTTIKKPPVKKHTPYTFNNLGPYFDVKTAEFIVEKDFDSLRNGYAMRPTSIGLVDPWEDHTMDVTVQKSQKVPGAVHRPTKSARQRQTAASGDRPPKEGSTHLPKYPVVTLQSPELATRELDFGDVPMLRKELGKKYSSGSDKEVEKEYRRTKQDFYRMELDKMKEVHPLNRNNLRAAYFAYLQNNPGAKKAIYECMSKMDEDEKEQKEKREGEDTARDESEDEKEKGDQKEKDDEKKE